MFTTTGEEAEEAKKKTKISNNRGSSRMGFLYSRFIRLQRFDILTHYMCIFLLIQFLVVGFKWSDVTMVVGSILSLRELFLFEMHSKVLQKIVFSLV